MRNILLVAILIVSLFSQTFARDTSPCKVGKRAPRGGFWTWAPASRLKVYVFEGDFRSDQIAYLLKPLSHWDAFSELTGAGVRISYAGTTTRMLECSNCVTIMRGSVFNKKTRHGSELKAFGEEGKQIIKYAAIHIDPVLMDRETLSNVIAHELGHSFGLLDCYNCAEGSTVMSDLKGMNIGNGMTGPTDCDVAAVKKVYLTLAAKIVVQPEDEGEMPVEDDTPVVEPEKSPRERTADNSPALRVLR
jgi:hypothetical protein